MNLEKGTEYVLTAEAVTEGHPDKMCDQISDAVLDDILKKDREAHVACECYCTTGLIVVGGQISTKSYADIPAIARRVVNGIGYNRGKFGFDADNCAVLTVIEEQSPDIAQGVNNASKPKLS